MVGLRLPCSRTQGSRALKFALVIIETEESKRNVLEDRAEHRKSIEAWMAEQGRAGKLVGGEAFETQEIGPNRSPRQHRCGYGNRGAFCRR